MGGAEGSPIQKNSMKAGTVGKACVFITLSACVVNIFSAELSTATHRLIVKKRTKNAFVPGKKRWKLFPAPDERWRLKCFEKP
jgi:hypothetical protein